MYLHCPTCRLTVHRERAPYIGETAVCPRCAKSGARVAMRSTPARFFRGTSLPGLLSTARPLAGAGPGHRVPAA